MMEACQVDKGVGALTVILDKFKEQKLRVGMLHGLENFPNKLGRDIDLLVHPDDFTKIQEIVYESLQSMGWEVQSHVINIGIEQVFGRLLGDGQSSFLEIDLIHSHPFRWRGHEMLGCRFSDSELLSEGLFSTHPWGWFCKNILIQTLAGNDEKVLNNIKQLKKRPSYLPQIRQQAKRLGYVHVSEIILNLIEGTSEPDRSAAKKLQGDARSAVMQRVLSPIYWPGYGVGLAKWVWRKFLLVFPRSRAAPVICLCCDDVTCAEILLDEFCKDYAHRLPFPEIVIEPEGKKASAWRAFLRYWLRGRSESAGLVAKIIYGDMQVEPCRSDLVIVLKDGGLEQQAHASSERKRIAPASALVLTEWMADAFMSKLQSVSRN